MLSSVLAPVIRQAKSWNTTISLRRIGLLLTRRWRGESAANSSLKRPKFPVSRENTGNFIDSSLRSASTAAKKRIKPEPYGPIPYAPEQGIFCSLAGNLNRQSGKFRKRPFLARLVVSWGGAILS